VYNSGIYTARWHLDTTLPAHRVETTLEQDGRLVLEHLPFRAGQAVEVILLPAPTGAPSAGPYSLRGTPVRYERPTEPVAQEDWEASR
jgi:hypothetical protein